MASSFVSCLPYFLVSGDVHLQSWRLVAKEGPTCSLALSALSLQIMSLQVCINRNLGAVQLAKSFCFVPLLVCSHEFSYFSPRLLRYCVIVIDFCTNVWLGKKKNLLLMYSYAISLYRKSFNSGMLSYPLRNTH